MAENIKQFKCPCCGGAVTFDSESQKMKCPYCDTEFDMDAVNSLSEEQNDGNSADEMQWNMDDATQWAGEEAEGMKVYVCKSCGGEIIADDTTVATKCPYCDNPVVMSGLLTGVQRPDYVIPFKLDKKAAKNGLEQHLKGKKFLPKVFKDQNHIDEIKGVYVPFWLFDADVKANVNYRATKVRHWSDSNYDYTETSYYSVKRSGKVSFNDVPVDGSSKMPDDVMESIEPFDMNNAVDFQTAYLSGYLADKYDVNAESSISRANERIKRSTEELFAATVKGYSTVNTVSSNIRLSNGKTKYALCPVWILNTTWNDKKYMFAMNGETGKFVGDLPVDKAAYVKWLVILTIILTIVVYIIAWIVHTF